MVEHEAVVIEMADVASGIEAVGGEEVLAAASAHAAQRVRPPDLDHPHCARGYGLSVVGVDDPDLHPVEGPAAAAPSGPRHVCVGAVAAVRAEGLGHAEQLRPRAGFGPLLGRQQRLQASRPQCRQIRPDRICLPCKCFRLVGPAAEQRDSLAFQQPQRGLGLWKLLGDQRGPGQQRGNQATGESAHPEERHGDIQPGGGIDTACILARSTAPNALP